MKALLIRHCESSGQAPDAELTTRGGVQAEQLADLLAAFEIGRVVSSPFRRARATIEPFARRAGLEIEVHDRLAERRLSHAPIANWREVVERSFRDPDYSVPGGESGSETFARGWAAIRAVLDADRGLPVIVSHGQLLALVLHSLDPDFGFRGWEALGNPDVFALEPGRSTALQFRRVFR